MALYNENLNPKKMKNPTVTILKEILRTKIKLDEEMEKTNNAILKEFMTTFVAEMKEKDEVFATVYQKPFYAGSYYSDLRISKPDEFDINLVLKFPFREEDVEVIYQPQTPSFVKYHLKNPAKYEDRYSKLLKVLFQDGYLIPEEMRKWIQSVVDKAKLTYRLPASCRSLSCTASGPARTIRLTTRSGVEIDIDLVPAIHCNLSKPPGMDGRVAAKCGTSLEGQT
ncbi:cyclic GMP-AMP synthase-like [Stegodyphus dumicola]|uniref:cyclic GMP-AMP synthase-like n=1 Tax=Stegodyphus dumicola TaxID=202533 RepID=UPI0015ACBF20|nr:cyclic GMP-AMP synthase-like [Stegodyphus dumicola]